MKKSDPPKLSDQKEAELVALGDRIDREEQAELKAKGRSLVARQKKIRATIDRLKAARLDRKLSLDDVSSQCGVPKANLSRIENGVIANPTIDTLLRVAEAVGVDLL